MPTPNTESRISHPALRSSRTAAGAAPVPRWEWRSFDCQPKLWRDALSGAVQTGASSLTSEIYLLTRHSPCNVKLRDGRVEVKQLLQTDAAGLELWQPLLNEAFPLRPDIFAELCDVWRRPRPDVSPTLPTEEHLLSFVAQHAPDVRVIPVRKWRRPYLVHDCVAERSTVLVGGWLLDTFSLEHADPAVLGAAIRAAHLDRARNTSYVVELKRRAGWEEDRDG